MPAPTGLGCGRPYIVLAVSFSILLYTILGSILVYHSVMLPQIGDQIVIFG
jgi:hypothetical protein